MVNMAQNLPVSPLYVGNGLTESNNKTKIYGDTFVTYLVFAA